MKFEIFFDYIILCIVSFLAGIIGIFTKDKLKTCKSLSSKIILFIKGMLGSMFVAYLIFELLEYLQFGTRLSVALGGFAAYMGTDALVKIESYIEKFVNKKVDKMQ